MSLCRFSFLITLVFVATSVSARVFEAALHQSKWSASGSKTLCQLSHEIPRYGKAVFRLAAGKPLALNLTVERDEADFADVQIADFPSRWMHSHRDNKVFPVFSENKPGHHKKLRVHGDGAETMLAALVEGRIPTFSYSRATTSPRPETRVALSAVNFLEPYDKFAACQQALLPFSHKDIQDQVLYFDHNSKTIHGRLKQPLDFVGRYLNAVEKKIVVVGSEAAKFGGKTDKKWFNKRFQSVKAELIKRGVNAKRIKSQYQLARNQESQNVYLHLYGPETSRYFGYKRKQINVGPKSKARLNKLARYLTQHFTYGKIIISAHTDNVGKYKANKEKSRKRAAYIRDYLQGKGVPTERMVIKAYGESKPGYSNRSGEGQAKNHRAYIDFVS